MWYTDDFKAGKYDGIDFVGLVKEADFMTTDGILSEINFPAQLFEPDEIVQYGIQITPITLERSIDHKQYVKIKYEIQPKK